MPKFNNSSHAQYGVSQLTPPRANGTVSGEIARTIITKTLVNRYKVADKLKISHAEMDRLLNSNEITIKQCDDIITAAFEVRNNMILKDL